MHGRGVLLVRVLILVAVGAFGGFLVIVFDSGASPVSRVAAGLAAALCVALPVRVLYVGARRYVRTGHWSASPEEHAAWRQKLAERGPRPGMHLAILAVLIAAGVLNLVVTVQSIAKEPAHWSSVVPALAWSFFLWAQVRNWYRERQSARQRVQRLDTSGTL